MPQENSKDIIQLLFEELQHETRTTSVRWGMLIDLQKCMGCHACTIACISENTASNNLVFRKVSEEEVGVFPQVTRKFLPKSCMQCQNPSCVSVCPVHATFLDEQTGIVKMNHQNCIACKQCIKACPYQARDFVNPKDEDKQYDSFPSASSGLETLLGHEQLAETYCKNNYLSRNNKKMVDKCNFCCHRLEKNILPACVSACLGRATIFGNLNNPNSFISKQLKEQAYRIMIYKEEQKTTPHVFYAL